MTSVADVHVDVVDHRPRGGDRRVAGRPVDPNPTADAVEDEPRHLGGLRLGRRVVRRDELHVGDLAVHGRDRIDVTYAGRSRGGGEMDLPTERARELVGIAPAGRPAGRPELLLVVATALDEPRQVIE